MKLTKQDIILLVVLTLCTIAGYFLFTKVNNKFNTINKDRITNELILQHKLDSLKYDINRLQITIDARDIKVDSLNKVITKNKSFYESWIKNINNTSIVSDDSARSIITDYLNTKCNRYMLYKK